MDMNPIKQIYKFNDEASLLADGYDDYRECAYPIEEALEGFDLVNLSTLLGCPATPKQVSRKIMEIVKGTQTTVYPIPITDVDRLDKHLDSIVFSFGSIFKLGLKPQQAIRALGVVTTANMRKLTAGKDEQGKQNKPVDFVGPEQELLKILQE